MIHRTLPAALLLSVAVAACAPVEEQAETNDAAATEADVAAIHALMDQWEAGLNAADADALLSLFTGDVVFMPPEEPAAVGQEAVRGWFGTLFAAGPQFDLRTDEVRTGGEWSVGIGTYSSSLTPEGGEAVTTLGKWIVLYERQPDESWLATHVIWNTDSPSSDAEQG